MYTAGLLSVDECRNCTAGRYCPDYNMTSHGPLCSPGMCSFMSTCAIDVNMYLYYICCRCFL